MIKITNRLADSGFVKVEFHKVTPCELWDKIVDNHIVEVHGLEDSKMLIDFLQR